MKQTNNISISGTIIRTTSENLSKLIRPFLDEYNISKNNYKMVLGDDGNNLAIDFNDPTGFEIYFQGYNNGDYLVSAGNDNGDIEAKKIVLDFIHYFDTKNIIYNIEIQYEYDNGQWRDEDFFVHPDFSWN
ncbi:hypothetical protein [Aquimarina mytili]|uniref:Uncharacterized protein n=1 Tax=Aquimarina mytili TaxID=874423 RepID=A0A936ZTJ0_9FLAO|nr:hypothetical protein [Aquimarina mytili]MBL0684423.1 hypothetical protein [Aquimarina mytili]